VVTYLSVHWYEGMGTGLSKTKPFLSLAIPILIIAIIPVLIPNPYYLNVINIIGLNTIVVVGLSLLIGYAGQISLGHAAFYGMGAYLSGILTVTYGLSPWSAMLVALLVTGSLALAIGIPTLKLRGHYLVMATLGFNLIINIILIQWDSMTGGPSGFPGIPALAVGSWAFDSDKRMYYLIWFFAFASIILAFNLVRSRVGRGLRALHGSEAAAASVGVRTENYKVKVFILSALYASLAGSLYAHYLTFISPKTFDIFFSVELVTMVIVGGMGSIWGALSGTVFLTPLPLLLHFFDEYKDIFYGLILVLILIFIPEGLVAAIQSRWTATRRSDAEEARIENAPSVRPVHVGASFGHQDSQAMPESGNQAILRVESVSIRFGGLMALGQVSFDMAKGSITALIGPNGAGKTTLINVISGASQPQSGKVFFRDREISRKRPYQIAAMGLNRTFQNLQIFENMTVLENVMVGLHAQTKNEFVSCLFRLPGFSGEEREIEERAWEVLKFFRLEDKGRLPASSLSYGDQKRIEMARALAPAPAVVLLDEPVAGLNMTETKEMADTIREIRSQGVSVLLVEHDMNLVMGISDKVVVLNYGRKIADGYPEQIQKDEEVLAAYLGGVA
jgi:branched-chain amino acid transport system permease protein